MRGLLIATTLLCGLAAGTDIAAAQSSIGVNTGIAGWNAAPYTLAPGPTPGPGSVIVTLRGRLYSGITLTSDSADVTPLGKEEPLGMFEYARLYPSFSGVAGNGMKYGAYLEIRQNSGGIGPNSLTGAAGVTSGGASGNTLIFRRETGYIGSDTWGTLLFGQTNRVIELFLTGTFENFDIQGSWNGDLQAMLNGATVPVWPFLETSATYGNTGVTWLSPQWHGFDMGLSYAPASATSGMPNCAFAQADSTSRDGCLRETQAYGAGTATWSPNTFAREVHEVQMVLRYQGAVGPVGLAATIGYVGAGLVRDGGGFIGRGADFQNPSAVDAGAQVTYNGLAFGGHFYGGRVNPNGSNNANPVPNGYGNATSFLIGASNAIGPVIVGASFFHTNRAGVVPAYWGLAGVRRFGTMAENGLDVGGTYMVAPGWAVSLSYQYATRHQIGASLTASAASLLVNNLHAQGIILENQFTW